MGLSCQAEDPQARDNTDEKPGVSPVVVWICTSSLGQGPQHFMCAPLGQFTAPHRLALCEPRQEEDTISSPTAKLFPPLNPQAGYYLYR